MADKLLVIKANLDTVRLAPSTEPDPNDILAVEKEEELQQNDE